MIINKEMVVPNYGIEGTQGPDGKPAIYTTVTNQNIVLNAPYQGLPTDYSKANGSILVFEGDKEVTQQATYTLKQTLYTAATLDGNKFKVTHLSADNGMFVVTVSYKEFVSDIMITTNVVRNGQSGPPTGIIESPTLPTEVYQGMLWKNTGNLSGFITDVTYIYRGSKWEKYIFTADNIYADNLSAITADLGDVTGGSFTGSKFINNYDSQLIRDTWQRGSLRIEDGVLKDESEYYNKTTGNVMSTNTFYTSHNALEQTSIDAVTGRHQVALFSSGGIALADTSFTEHGYVNLTYEDLMVVEPTILDPSINFKRYAESGPNTPTVSRNGRNIQLYGAFANLVQLESSFNLNHLITVLPEWARPRLSVNFVVQGSTANVHLLTIDPDGSVYTSRYSKGGVFTPYVVNTWCNITCNYVAGDIDTTLI